MAKRATLNPRTLSFCTDDEVVTEIESVAEYERETVSGALRRIVELGLQAWYEQDDD